MTHAEQLNYEIGFSRWFLKDLLMDPLLNSEQIGWVRWMLRGLESHLGQWELHGFDHGSGHSFSAFTICKN